jgi:hypothetical protein
MAEEVDVRVPGLAARKAVHSPDWAWTFAGPLAGTEVGLVGAADETVSVPAVGRGGGWCELAVARPTAACGEACEVCPGSEPVAAAAAVPSPNVATAAVAATFAVKTLESTELVFDVTSGGEADTAALIPATTDASRGVW